MFYILDITGVRCSRVHVVSCVDVGASYIPTKPELHESGTKSGANKAWFQFQSVWEFCKEDTGREIFALKAGLAVLLVSLLILFEAPYQIFGPNIVWAILTALHVFEGTYCWYVAIIMPLRITNLLLYI